MNAAPQSATAPVVEALYVATNPYDDAVKFFESKNWIVHQVYTVEELKVRLSTLRQQGERKIPLVILFGHLQELENPPEGINTRRALVARIAADTGEIRALIPFAPISSDNAAFLTWTTEERKGIGLESLRIIGFGSDPERPTRTVALGKAEGAYLDLAQALGLTSPQHKERGRG